MSKSSTDKWNVKLIEDGEDLILPLPDEVLMHLDLKEGDVLEWIDNQDGTFSLKKKDAPWNVDSGLTENLA
jgi:hypothetical protein